MTKISYLTIINMGAAHPLGEPCGGVRIGKGVWDKTGGEGSGSFECHLGPNMPGMRGLAPACA